MSDYGIDYEAADYSGIADETPLIDRFYDRDDTIYKEWIGDALVDCDELDDEHLHSILIVIHGAEIRASGQAQRGDWLAYADSIRTRDEYDMKLARLVRNRINGYMKSATERCK